MVRPNRDAVKIMLILPAALICLAGGPVRSARAQDSASDAQGAPAKDKDADTVETVVVTGQKKSTVTRSIDATTYDQTNNPVAQTGTAADVLNTVPSVNVSPNGDVTLRGNGNVSIYVNGKPSAFLSGESRALTLQSMSGSDIASIEVITNPSAKYGADGSSIINIVFKKDRTPGTSATVIANVGNDGRKNASISANMTRRAFSLHATLGIRKDLRPIQETTSTVQTNPFTGSGARSEQNLAVNPRRLTYNFVVGADYSISSDDTLSAEAAWKGNSAKNTIDEFNKDFDASGDLTAAFDRRSTGPRRQTDTSQRVDFTHTGSSGSKWDLSLANSETVNFKDKSYRNIFSFPAIPDQIVRVLTNSDHRLLQASGNGVVPIGEHAQLSFGLDFRRTNDDLLNLNANIDPVTGTQTVNPGLTNRSDIVRGIGAGYMTYQQDMGPLTVLAGLRFETAHTSIGRGSAGPPISRSDRNFNPTLHLRWDIGGGDTITSNISRSVQRPDAAALDPFVTYVDTQNLISGNPNLKPQSVTSGEVGYETDTGKTDQTVTAYFRRSRHTVTDYSYFVSSDVLLTTKINGGEGQSYGVEYTLSGALTPALKYDLSANLFHAQIQALDLTGTDSNSGTSYNAKAALDYSPTERNEIRLDANFIGKTITAQGTQSGSMAFNASWLHRITPKLLLTFRANDITNGSNVVSITRTATVFRTDDTLVKGRQVYFGLQYKL